MHHARPPKRFAKPDRQLATKPEGSCASYAGHFTLATSFHGCHRTGKVLDGELEENASDLRGGKALNRFERLVRTHRLLSSRRPVPMRRFIEELGVTRNTVTRDFEYLRLFLGAPILYDRAANGHYYHPDAPAFELPGLWLNQSELYALLATEQLLEAIQPGMLAPYIGPLKGRVRKLLGQSGHHAEAVARAIRVQHTSQRQVDNDIFAMVSEAVLAPRILEIHYHARTRDETTQRRIHPQRLINHRGNWYLVAHCELARNLRIFSVDRIRQAALAKSSGKAVPDDTLNRFLQGSFGIFSGVAEQWAILRFTSQAARWVAEERWHPNQIWTWHGEIYELQVPFSNPTELIMEILKHGPDVEVVSPVELRSTVAEKLRYAANQYC